MNLLHTYLSELHAVRVTGAGVKETSYYPAVSGVFNALGKTLKPPVRCIINLKNQGAGIPDGGLFTPDQYAQAADLGALPSRGVLEVKGAGDDIASIVASAQVQKYWDRYGQVLVTNLREFVLVGRDAGGQKVSLERFALAPTEAEFWALAARPDAAPEGLAERFSEYLKRVLLHAAPLATPQDVAWFLASYARDARSRIAHAPLPALAPVRTALEEALGLTFQGEKGEHFFRSTLVQTLFYGVFSAWVLWAKSVGDPSRPGKPGHPPRSGEGEESRDGADGKHELLPSPLRGGGGACAGEGFRSPRAAEGSPTSFDWRVASYYLHVPMIQTLFEEVSKPSKLGALGLVEVLNWTGAALNRVDRAAFFARFEQAHAVQYFYEPFLQAFDPELRKELGVWYTPPEIVRYMVARVDTALREELGLADGLADPNVYVLDPCCGTGAYLVEVLRKIGETLDAGGGDALGGHDLKVAARERVFGFEILPAPYVVAHLQLGLLLQNAGVPLAPAQGGKDAERVGVFLTNALTGWEPPSEQAKAQLAQLALSYPDLKKEYDAAEQVKHSRKILVILGNPPYNSFAGVGVSEERALSLSYRTTRHAPAPQGQGLNDLYVRFFRMAERSITEATGQGIVCFISNYSWLDGLSHTGMRERYLEAFDDLWIDCLNGDKYKTGKVTPEGLPDPSVFSTDFNREGIQVGTAIALLVRKQAHQGTGRVQFKQWWGRTKRADLLASLEPGHEAQYQPLTPTVKLGLPFTPLQTSDDYQDWPLLPDLFPVSFPGVKTSRDDVVVDIDRDRLERRMRQYFDLAISHEQMRQIAPGAMSSDSSFNAVATRETLQKRGFKPENIIPYCYRPFDVRWLYWEADTKLIDRSRPDYLAQVFQGNIWVEARQRQPMERFDRGYFVRPLADNFGNGLSNFFPLWLKPKPTADLFTDEQSPPREPQPNLTAEAQAYLHTLGADPEYLFYHTLALLHAPAYREENGGALRQDWPRVPLPDSRELLEASAALGRQVAALLDTETPVPGVTAGTIRAELRLIGPIARVGGGQLDAASGDLRVAAGWGHGGKDGVTMPGKGKSVARPYSTEETAALDTVPGAQAHLGETTWDISLNGTAYWKNVPARVWDYTLGGYQVVKKWLSYREYALLGRDLTPDEAREVTHTARRLAALRLLETGLNTNYQAVKAAAFAWGVGT